jgi:hypothetical protein
MSAARPPTAGRTRACPHCKATILDSAAVCPACRHHLRFNPAGQPASAPAVSAFRVEGVIENSAPLEHWEYAVVVAVRDERGEEIARQIVNVGALAPGERRSCVVSIDVFKPLGA